MLLDHAKIMPYYFYMCDMIPNSEHWRLAVSEAQALQHDIMGYLPGYATPRIVCDVPFVGKRWVHQTTEYDRELGISYWTKNYRTGSRRRGRRPRPPVRVLRPDLYPAAGRTEMVAGAPRRAPRGRSPAGLTARGVVQPVTRYPESHVFYRKLGRAYPLIVGGRGCWLTANDGRTYLDGCGGAFVASLGHGLRGPGRAMARQAKRVAYVNGTVFTTPPVEALAERLAALAPGNLDYVYFLCSGSEAVEAACKLARQYWVEVGRQTKQRLIALRPGYHGNTLLALSASARSHYKKLYGDWLVDVAFIPAPYPYRCGCVSDGAMCDACANGLERTILDLGPDTVAALIAEPVGGTRRAHPCRTPTTSNVCAPSAIATRCCSLRTRSYRERAAQGRGRRWSNLVWCRTSRRWERGSRGRLRAALRRPRPTPYPRCVATRERLLRARTDILASRSLVCRRACGAAIH